MTLRASNSGSSALCVAPSVEPESEALFCLPMVESCRQVTLAAGLLPGTVYPKYKTTALYFSRYPSKTGLGMVTTACLNCSKRGRFMSGEAAEITHAGIGLCPHSSMAGLPASSRLVLSPPGSRSHEMGRKPYP